MEHVERLGISLLETPDEIYPMGEVLTDVVALQSLSRIVSAVVHTIEDGAPYPSIQQDEQQRIIFRPQRELDVVDALSVALLNPEIQIGRVL